jgi:hypothetical protein
MIVEVVRKDARRVARLLMVMSRSRTTKYRAPVDDFGIRQDDDVSIDTIQQGTVEQARIIVVAATNQLMIWTALQASFGVQLPIDPPGTRKRRNALCRQL